MVAMYFKNTLPTKGQGVPSYRFEGNFFHHLLFTYAEVDPTRKESAHLMSLPNDDYPIAFVDNRWDGDKALTDRFAGGNGTKDNVTATGNEQTTITPVAFVDSGFPADFDYTRVVVWSVAYGIGANKGKPIPHVVGDIVLDDSEVYRCKLAHTPEKTATALTDAPKLRPERWEHLAPLADDVRLPSGSPYAGIGLLDHAP
jgi:hypothetical protein